MAKPAAPWRIKGKKVYRSYSQDELDAQYDVAAPETPERVRERQWAAESCAAARKAANARLGVAYGPGADETLDIFPAARPGAPVLFDIHGGYWKQFGAADESLYAPVYVGAGAAFVAMDYTLAPRATLDEIVRQCRAALAWTVAHATEFNGDPARIHLLGRSAGGHLCAMMLATDWAAHGLRRSPIAGATLISGLYDLEPIMLSFANEWCRLDAQSAWRLSPIYHLPDRKVPAIVAWGGAETDEFRRQSQDLAVALQSRGWPTTTIEISGAGHSGSRAELVNRESPLSRAVTAQLGL
jgi:arylformamidase